MTKANVGDWIRITKEKPEVDREIGKEYEVIDTVSEIFNCPQVIVERLRRENGEAYEEEFVTEDCYEVIGNRPEPDAVNSPQHYTTGRFETIEMIKEIAGGYDDGFLGHCVGTSVKYFARAPHKHESPAECLRKAAKYAEWAADRAEELDEK
ncbi:DUF3310 domain-containing protein [Salibacterium aidingense]|uniref:DUF3310 domain-containing protein n=1 Tax=Salibacterium aidingense TaxID=384933 RepID=UPI003BE48A09